ncbi:MAG: hypothetical protein IPK60_25150 [Sandaracinaceae bacterium]|nr:hypothetical protein [Sandaracinaceae bacterium]
MNRAFQIIVGFTLAACSASHAATLDPRDAGTVSDASSMSDAAFHTAPDARDDSGSTPGDASSDAGDDLYARYIAYLMAGERSAIHGCTCTWASHYDSEDACIAAATLSDVETNCSWTAFSDHREQLQPTFDCTYTAQLAYFRCMGRVPCDESVASDFEYSCSSQFDEVRYSCPERDQAASDAMREQYYACIGDLPPNR